jgi:sugar diacid utilization regulator
MFKVLCQFLALSMKTTSPHWPTGAPLVETLLLDIMENKITEPTVITKRLALFDIELREYLVAIVIQMEERYRKVDKIFLLKQMLQSLFKRTTMLVYGEEIVIVYDSNTIDGCLGQGRIEALTELLEDHHCRAAISMSFDDLNALHAHYRQAVVCFQIADYTKCTDRILFYENQLLPHMLLNFGETFDLTDLVPPSVWKLRNIDEQKNSDLVESLFCYIRNSQDITSAANEMHIHYNTLKYRIKRIVEETGIDLDNPEVTFRIMLAERALGFFGNTGIQGRQKKLTA